MYSAHVPSPPGLGEQATRLPIRSEGNIPLPDFTTVPDPSSPGANGQEPDIYPESMLARSEGFMGEAAIFTSTSPGPGMGMGADSITNFPPGL